MLERVVQKRESFYTVGGNANWYSHYREQYGGSLKKWNMLTTPYDPAIPLLGTYLEKTTTQTDTCTLKFIHLYCELYFLSHSGLLLTFMDLPEQTGSQFTTSTDESITYCLFSITAQKHMQCFTIHSTASSAVEMSEKGENEKTLKRFPKNWLQFFILLLLRT